MYQVSMDGIVILDASQDILISSPTLTMADGAAGSFSFEIYDDNPGYGKAKNLTSRVTVLWEDEIVYIGRVISVEQTFDRSFVIDTEGEMAYLADSIQRQIKYNEPTIRSFLAKLISNHNSQVDETKKIVLGMVTVSHQNDQIVKITNYETTLDVIKKELVECYGGHLRMRWENGKRYLDYLADWPRLSGQKIEFGENLLSYSEGISAIDLATVCIPLGARQEDSPIEGVEKRLTIESVNNGSDSIELPEAVAKYGQIVKTVIFDDLETPQVLKKQGENWLKDNQYEDLTLTLTAVDLADLGIEADHLRLLDRVRCTSKAHGLDREMGITEIKITLTDPEANVYTLGSKQKSFSQSVQRAQASLEADLRNQPSKSYVLKQALENATEMLTSVGKDGHVIVSPSIVDPNELYITDYPSLEKARRCWRWNLNGLGYSSNGIKGPFDLAITMDGRIAGRFIAAHSIGADQIDVQYTTTQEKKWQDELGNNYWTSGTVATKIKNSADSVLISASKTMDTKLGSYYTKAQINTTVSGIESTVAKKVGSNEIISKINQSAERVKIKASKVDVDADAIRLKASTIAWSCKNSQMTSDGDLTTWKLNAIEGIELYAGNVNGEPYLDFHTSPKVSRSRDYDARLSLENGVFKMKNANGQRTMGLHCGDLDCYKIDATYLKTSGKIDAGGSITTNGTITGGSLVAKNGISGTLFFVKIDQMASNGTASLWSNNCKMVFKSGILTSATF